MTDQGAREAARTVFDRPLVVEAGAGTGKTTTLVARLCTWSLGPGWARARAAARPGAPAADLAARVLDGVVAITFTEAAAAEMASRFGEALLAIASGRGVAGLDTLPVDAAEAGERARLLLAAVDRLAVSTIHSWCSRVLAMAPVQAGLHPQFQVDADGTLLGEVVHEVLVDWFTEVFAAPSPEQAALLTLAAARIGSADVAAAVLQLAKEAVPAEAFAAAAPDDAEAAALVARADAALSAWREVVEPAFARPKGRIDKALALVAAVATLAAAVPAVPGLAGLQALTEAARELPDRERETLRAWSRGTFSQTEATLLADAAAEAEHRSAALLRLLDHLRTVDLVRFDAARTVLEPLLARVEAERNRRGVLSFQQLLRRTRDLLAHNPQVLDQLRRSLDLLHVDEFQDTDGLQCDIVASLALEGEVRPALFVVGDPKQSIYGWRSADLTAYQAFVDRVMAAGGVRLSLDYNRRSVSQVLDEVERVIAPSMRPVTGYQPAFQPLVSHRGAGAGLPGGRAAVEYWVSWPRDADGNVNVATTGEAATLEAEAIAADLVGLRAQGLRWGAVGILLRSTSDMERYLDALRAAGVPFVVERDKQYFRRREIVDATATVRAVLEPTDVLALLALMRSPAVGVPDAALLPLWRRHLPARMAALRGLADLDAVEAIVREAAAETASLHAPGVGAVAGWEEALLEALRAVAWLREHADTLPADRFVEELRTRIPAEPLAAGRYLGAFRLANLQRFYADLAERLVQAGGDVQVVLRALRRGVAGHDEAEEARPPDLAEDAVRVMTIHKAKGLEFDHVYVLQAHRGSGGHRGQDPADQTSATQLRDGRWHLSLFGAHSLRHDEAEAHQARIAAQERLRLLYVAMTRARERLVCLGAWPEGGELGAAQRVEDADSLLQLIAARAGGHPKVGELVEAGGSVQIEAVLWRLPALLDGPPATVPRSLPPDPTPPDLEARLSRRAALVEASGLRMARRTSAPASDAAHRELEERGHLPPATEPGPPAPGAPAEGPPPEAALLATAVGTAVHKALECMDPAAAPAVALAAARADAEGPLRVALPEALWPEARRRAEALLARFVNGALGAHFRGLGPHLVARELPTLAGAPDEGDGPVGFYAGAVDLVHLDPTTGELVVVDFKTDSVRSDAELDARVAAYRHQAGHYAQVLQSALGLAAPPRTELWFLALDRRVS